MYEELVCALRQRAMDLPEKFSRNAVNINLLMKAADAIEELSEPKWIPVKKKKPEHGQYVLAIFKNSGGYFVLDTHDLYKDGNKTWSKSAVKPLAWMPLPNPPKEETC